MMVDIEKLRSYLIDYYGTAIFSGMPAAFVDLSRVERADADELIQIAQREHIDLYRFVY